MSPSPVEEPEAGGGGEEMEISDENEEVVYEQVSEEEEVDEEEEEVEISEADEEVAHEDGVHEEVPVEEEEEEAAAEEEEETPKQNVSVAETISQFQFLHGALSDFLSHYNAIQQTLDSLNSSVDTKSRNGSKTVKTEAKTDCEQHTRLQYICRTMGAKALRRYCLAHLSEMDHLREELPRALKLAPDPAWLTLSAISRFYLQRRNCYAHGDVFAIDHRRFAILLLEFYVLAGFPEAPASVQKNAMDAAIAWRRRINEEGGIESVSAEDALGLMLLLASFGVPREFTSNDLLGLLRLSNLKNKGDVLRSSPILVQKMSDIFTYLLAKGKHFEAVDLICAFGLEEKFPPLSLLLSFVKKSHEVALGERQDGQCSSKSRKESYYKELAALKSVKKYAEDHKFNASELADLNIDQKIAECEKEILKAEPKVQDKNLKRRFKDADHNINEKIAECEKEILKAEPKLQDKNLKRRFKDAEPLKNQDNQAKQLRPTVEASGCPPVQSIRQTQDKGTTIYDSLYPYNGHIANVMPLPYKASHGLVDINGVRVQGHAGGWHGTSLHQEFGGQSLRGTPYSLGHASVNYPAAAGQNFCQPYALGQNVHRPPASAQNFYHHPASGQSLCQSHEPPRVIGGRNLYQFADSVSDREVPNYSATSNARPTAAITLTNPSHQSYAREFNVHASFFNMPSFS